MQWISGLFVGLSSDLRLQRPSSFSVSIISLFAFSPVLFSLSLTIFPFAAILSIGRSRKLSRSGLVPFSLSHFFSLIDGFFVPCVILFSSLALCSVSLFVFHLLVSLPVASCFAIFSSDLTPFSLSCPAWAVTFLSLAPRPAFAFVSPSYLDPLLFFLFFVLPFIFLFFASLQVFVEVSLSLSLLMS